MSSQTLLFVGTDTDVGKTHAVSLVAKHALVIGHRVGVYKPVASGCEDRPGGRWASDADAIWRAAGCPRTLDDVCPQKFIKPISPDLAARAEHTSVDEDLIRRGLREWQSEFSHVLVEGAGGLFSPISDRWLNLDLAKQLSVDHLILVAANRIGVIHQVLSCVDAAAHHGLSFSGIILSTTGRDPDPSQSTNQRSIEARTPVPVLATLPWGETEWPADGPPVPGFPPPNA